MWDHVTVFKLSQRSGSLGLNCKDDGLTLAGIPLLIQHNMVFAPRDEHEIRYLIEKSYGNAIDSTSITNGLRAVARALNEGEIGRAMIAAVHLRLPDLDIDGAMRIADANETLQKYDPDEVRDGRGRWATGRGNKAPISSAITAIPQQTTPSNIAFQAAQLGNVTDAAYNGYFHDQVVESVANYLRSRGATVLTNVAITTVDGITAIADMVIQGPGEPPEIIEVKTGINPTFTDPQRYVYPMSQIGGHVSSTDPRISQLGLKPGVPFPPIKVFFFYQQGPNHPYTVIPAPNPLVP